MVLFQTNLEVYEGKVQKSFQLLKCLWSFILFPLTASNAQDILNGLVARFS